MATGRAVKLSESHLRLLYDTFKLLDDDRDGYIDKTQFFTLFRALGQTVSDASLAKAFEAATAEQAKEAPKTGTEGKAAAALPNTVSFTQFAKTFSQFYQKPVTAKLLTEAFSVFDPSHSGKLSWTQIQEILVKRGEPIPKAELEEFALVAAVSHAKQVDYALLASRMTKGPAGIAAINDL